MDEVEIWLPNSVMRQRATVGHTTIEKLKKVTGFMKPGYVDNLPDGRRVAQLYRSDIKRIEDGYGCGECLATFSERFPDCPSCGHVLDANTDIVQWEPDYWKPSPPTNTNTDWD